MAESMMVADAAEPGEEMTSTLVKYNNPVLVIKHAVKSAGDKRKMASKPDDKAAGGVGGGDQHIIDARQETEEILNSILPPRCWEADGQLWSQTISSVPATRLDVINLQEQLDARLRQTQARETGICPVRRDLYTECFDELIRQVTINCSERGLLLLRVRDEIAMSMEAYETLYCSSVAFGLRKALQAQEGKEALMERVAAQEKDKEALETLLSDMKIKAEQSERRNTEIRASEERKHNEEIAFLKKTNAQLKAQLEGIIAPKK